ncbi:hypothetical protein OH773_10255 [Buttiauxella sp. WJP83]|uniref:hypothetical protein n=1 Tax=Buttiauxella sp. WJP83 TaxID=2986951 RepID=UPI0022DE301A|nr:hypothetical protein [Buttiauxella sp. WJP83]WBM72584.1 hypothetical protein OH773_10255 [Buttiauxella sp. WJP83]
MKIKILALVVAACSFSVHAADLAAAQEAVAHAQRMNDAAQGDVDSTQSTYGKGSPAAWADASNHAGALRAQTESDLKAANQNLTNAQAQAKLESYGTKMNSAGNPVSMVTGTKMNPTGSPVVSVVGQTGNSTMNVSSSTLAPSTKVKTDKGIVTAGSLPKNTQVSVAFNSVFSSPVKGGSHHSVSRSSGEHGTGNGANNAANSQSAHGLGGSESIGGGRNSGGFHY